MGRNDVHTRSVSVGTQPRILYVEGHPESAHYLRDALVGEGMDVPAGDLVVISMAYFFALLFIYVSTAIVAQWMAATYGARHSLGIHFALVTIIAAPLVVGSAMHLFPSIFLNVLVFIPTVMWSMYLLYKGLPIVLRINPERPPTGGPPSFREILISRGLDPQTDVCDILLRIARESDVKKLTPLGWRERFAGDAEGERHAAMAYFAGAWCPSN